MGENALYLDYADYKGLGGAAEEAAFTRLEYMAEKKIDRYTQGRVKAMGEVPEAVQRCMVEIINAMSVADPTKTASEVPLSGFSNDGYSESYAEPMTADRLESNLHGLIVDYLSTETDDNGTPLLWLGVDA